MKVSEGIMQGLKEALEHAEGKRKCRTSTFTEHQLKDIINSPNCQENDSLSILTKKSNS